MSPLVYENMADGSLNFRLDGVSPSFGQPSGPSSPFHGFNGTYAVRKPHGRI